MNRSFSLISSFLVSDVSESLISLKKNEQMGESLIFLRELLIRSFLDTKWAIHSEMKWANSQPCLILIHEIPWYWYRRYLDTETGDTLILKQETEEISPYWYRRYLDTDIGYVPWYWYRICTLILILWFWYWRYIVTDTGDTLTEYKYSL